MKVVEVEPRTLQEMPVSKGDAPQGKHSDVTWTEAQIASQDGAKEEEKENDEEGKENKGEEAENAVPVDQGWAWVVMLGQFTITLVMVGYGRALSILFLEFKTMFNISVTMGTVTFAVMTIAFGLGNFLVSNVLLTSENARTLIVAGCFLSSACISLSSVSPNIAFLIACHFFMGLANAASYIPSILLLGHYFSARRAFATSVGNVGVSVAYLVFPPLTQFLMTSYGIRGAILLTGGVCMQAVVAASLCRPVTFYNKESTRHRGRSRDSIILKVAQSRDDRHGNESRKEKVEIKLRRYGDTGRINRNSLGNSSCELSPCMQQESETESAQSPLKPLFSHLSPEVVKKSHDTNDENGAVLVSQRTDDISTNLVITMTTASSDSNTSALHRVCSSSAPNVCGSTVTMNTAHTMQSSPTFRQDTAPATQRTFKAEFSRSCSQHCFRTLSSVTDFSLMRNWLFRLIVVYQTLAFTTGLIAVYFPAMAVSNGISREKAAVLMTVMGSVDLISRLLVGFMADMDLIKRTHLVSATLVILSLACHFTRLYTSFTTLALFAVAYGLLGGVCQNLLAVIIIDLLGIQNLGKTMSLIFVLNSLFTSANHPLIGLMVDATGTYAYPFNYIGVCLLLGATCVLFEPVARRLEAQRMRTLTAPSAV